MKSAREQRSCQTAPPEPLKSSMDRLVVCPARFGRVAAILSQAAARIERKTAQGPAFVRALKNADLT